MGIKIALFGGRGSGKDTVVEMLQLILDDLHQIRLAQYVVEACKAFGIDEPTRTDLAFVGTEIGRNMIGKNVWINKALKDPANNIPTMNYIISDVRFPNEYETFVKNGFIPILIDAEENVRIERVILRDGTIDMKLLESESEQAFKTFKAKYILDNNGTRGELLEQLVILIEMLKEEKE